MRDRDYAPPVVARARIPRCAAMPVPKMIGRWPGHRPWRPAVPPPPFHQSPLPQVLRHSPMPHFPAVSRGREHCRSARPLPALHPLQRCSHARRTRRRRSVKPCPDHARRNGDGVTRPVDDFLFPHGLPIFASMATRRPSSVPTKILPFHCSVARFTRPQHTFTAHSPGTLGSNFHNCLPVFASNA